MATAKTFLFDEDLRVKALFFKTLAHPARLQILKFLAESNTCISGDLSDLLPLSRTTVNQHLNELKASGLIQGSVQGVKVNYCLDPQKVEELKSFLVNFLEQLQLPDDFCCK